MHWGGTGGLPQRLAARGSLKERSEKTRVTQRRGRLRRTDSSKVPLGEEQRGPRTPKGSEKKKRIPKRNDLSDRRITHEKEVTKRDILGHGTSQ